MFGLRCRHAVPALFTNSDGEPMEVAMGGVKTCRLGLGLSFGVGVVVVVMGGSGGIGRRWSSRRRRFRIL